MKENIVIPIFYKIGRNKTYVINTTSRRIYWHRHKPFNLNNNLIAGFSVFFVVAIVPAMRNWLVAQGLDNLSVNIRVLLVFIGVAIGGLAFFLGRKKRKFVRFEDFLVKYPEAEEVNCITDIEELLEEISGRVDLMNYTTAATTTIGIG